MKNSSYEWIDHWQRKFFALFVALCIWLATRGSLHTTRTFLEVPVRMINIPSKWSICDLGPEGQLPNKVGLVLRGKKIGLNQMLDGKMEVIVDAKGHSGPWVEKITAKQIHSSTNDDLTRVIKKVIIGEIPIPLTPTITEKIDLTLRTKGHIKNHTYTLIDFTPEEETQIICGPKETVKALKEMRLVGEIDLLKVDRDQLKWQWERNNQSQPHEELTYPYIHPIKYSSPLVKPNASTVKPSQVPRLFLLANLPQTYEGQFLVHSHPGELDEIGTQNLEDLIGGQLFKHKSKWQLKVELEIDGISGELLRLIKDQSSLQFTYYIGGKSNASQWLWHLHKIKSLENRYVAKMREQISDSANLSEKILRSRFYYFLKNMKVMTKGLVKLEIKPRDTF